MEQLVVTAVGPDRPGLVDELTGYLMEAGGNLADSRMVNLRGQFALILQVEAPDAATGRALAEGVVAAGEKIGLYVSAVAEDPSAAAPATGLVFRLRTYAMDQPGIVHRITHLLHNRGINIEELQTRLEPGSYDGAPKFAMELRMTVPAAVPINELRQELQDLCNTLNCNLEIIAGQQGTGRGAGGGSP